MKNMGTPPAHTHTLGLLSTMKDSSSCVKRACGSWRRWFFSLGTVTVAIRNKAMPCVGAEPLLEKGMRCFLVFASLQARGSIPPFLSFCQVLLWRTML